MCYHAPEPEEERPNPRDGEVIVFSDHMNRGFSPPGSKFFREVLHFFNLHPQDIGPNSISNICNFQVLCEVYIQEELAVELFREYFYLNRQNECTNGLSLELGRHLPPYSLAESSQRLESDLVLMSRHFTSK